MGRLFELIEAHQARQVYPPSLSRIAADVGVSRQTLLNWREPSRLIDKRHLQDLARVLGVRYEVVRDALLEDIDYMYPDASDGASAAEGSSASGA